MSEKNFLFLDFMGNFYEIVRFRQSFKFTKFQTLNKGMLYTILKHVIRWVRECKLFCEILLFHENIGFTKFIEASLKLQNLNVLRYKSYILIYNISEIFQTLKNGLNLTFLQKLPSKLRHQNIVLMSKLNRTL